MDQNTKKLFIKASTEQLNNAIRFSLSF